MNSVTGEFNTRLAVGAGLDDGELLVDANFVSRTSQEPIYAHDVILSHGIRQTHARGNGVLYSVPLTPLS